MFVLFVCLFVCFCFLTAAEHLTDIMFSMEKVTLRKKKKNVLLLWEGWGRWGEVGWGVGGGVHTTPPVTKGRAASLILSMLVARRPVSRAYHTCVTYIITWMHASVVA